MDAQLSGHTPRRTRETEEKRRQNPVRQRPPTLVEQGIGEIVEGALATVTPVAFAAGSVVVIPPRIDISLTFRTLCRTSEAILEELLVEGGLGALYRLFHAL